MSILYLDGKRFRRIIHAATAWLQANEKTLNDINVFPVPDGDTGTNMAATLQSMVRSLSGLEGDRLPRLAEDTAQAALLGARGNSGVILSQFFMGFSESIGGQERLTAQDVAAALQSAYSRAYRAVSQPKEGTVLSVARQSVAAAQEKARTETDLMVILETLLASARRALAETPEQLPQLKEAGVVDAGAQGYVYIFEGIYRLLQGLRLPEPGAAPADAPEAAPGSRIGAADSFYGYCLELFINGEGMNPETVRGALLPQGDSLIVAGAGGLVKVHIHSPDPGRVLQTCQKFGVLTGIKVENMDQQHAARERAAEEKETALVAVVPGPGLRQIFLSLGCDCVVDGGQSMNPSVADLVNALGRYPAHAHLILPNHGNIILTAEQVKTVYPQGETIVIPSHSIPEGLAALLAYNPDLTAGENAGPMIAAIKRVKTGEITTAARDALIQGVSVRTGDIIAMANGAILGAHPDPEAALLATVRNLQDPESAVVSVFYGKDVAEPQAHAAANRLRELFPRLEIEMKHGGQPHYFYIISVE